MANRHRCGRATAAIEPLMIILMGGIVTFIAASILLPIFKMSQWVK
jgi:type II secretory pathway component PulF